MLMLMIFITSVTLVMTKVMVTKSDDDFFNLLECPIPLSSVLSVTKNPGHFSSYCISQTWSYGFVQMS